MCRIHALSLSSESPLGKTPIHLWGERWYCASGDALRPEDVRSPIRLLMRSAAAIGKLIQTFQRLLTMTWDTPKEPFDRRSQQSILWVSACNGEKSEECQAGKQRDHFDKKPSGSHVECDTANS